MINKGDVKKINEYNVKSYSLPIKTILLNIFHYGRKIRRLEVDNEDIKIRIMTIIDLSISMEDYLIRQFSKENVFPKRVFERGHVHLYTRTK